MENDGHDDRRQEPRVPIELRHEYQHLNAFFSDYTKNIGRGGTFIQTDKPLAIGAEFVFTLVVPTLREPLTLTGRVQWRVTPESARPGQAAGMGIGFVYASEAERARVETVVENLIVESLGPVVGGKLMKQVRRTDMG